MRETACSHRVSRSHRSNRPWAAKSIPHTGGSCGGTHPSHTFYMEFLRWAYTLYPNHHPPPPPPHPRCIHLFYDMYIWSVVCCQVQISSRVALGLTLTILGICSVTLILYMFDTHAHDAVGQCCDEWDSQLIQLVKHGNKIRYQLTKLENRYFSASSASSASSATFLLQQSLSTSQKINTLNFVFCECNSIIISTPHESNQCF